MGRWSVRHAAPNLAEALLRGAHASGPEAKGIELSLEEGRLELTATADCSTSAVQIARVEVGGSGTAGTSINLSEGDVAARVVGDVLLPEHVYNADPVDGGAWQIEASDLEALHAELSNADPQPSYRASAATHDRYRIFLRPSGFANNWGIVGQSAAVTAGTTALVAAALAILPDGWGVYSVMLLPVGAWLVLFRANRRQHQDVWKGSPFLEIDEGAGTLKMFSPTAPGPPRELKSWMREELRPRRYTYEPNRPTFSMPALEIGLPGDSALTVLGRDVRYQWAGSTPTGPGPDYGIGSAELRRLAAFFEMENELVRRPG